ncbi:MAG: hypothetical protein PHC34_08455 [Candidatus Gastranaerophilales bacterium]|nr:hypothetical protein [Candidatus Gastranaerophilales bacterium]
MINTINNHNDNRESLPKKIYNLRAEKLVREASDTFIYYRDYDLALTLVNEAVRLDPTHVKALILKGDILFCIDKDNEALEYFDMAINADPFCAEAYGSKAGTLDVLGRQTEALNCCEMAFENITLKDRHLLPSLYDQKIAILIRLKRFEEARGALKKCAKRLSEEDGSHLISCYQNIIDASCKEKKRKRELVTKNSMKLVY